MFIIIFHVEKNNVASYFKPMKIGTPKKKKKKNKQDLNNDVDEMRKITLKKSYVSWSVLPRIHFCFNLNFACK